MCIKIEEEKSDLVSIKLVISQLTIHLLRMYSWKSLNANSWTFYDDIGLLPFFKEIVRAGNA